MTSGSPSGTPTSVTEPALARSVRCDDERVYLTLTDGRTVTAPLSERLRQATPAQRAAGHVEGFGTLLRWDDIDEDLSVAAILGVSEDELEELAGFEEITTS